MELSEDLCSFKGEVDDEDAALLISAVPTFPPGCMFFKETGDDVLLFSRWFDKEVVRLSLSLIRPSRDGLCDAEGLVDCGLAGNPPAAVLDVRSLVLSFDTLRVLAFSLIRYAAALRNDSPKTAAKVRDAEDCGSEGASRCTRYLG